MQAKASKKEYELIFAEIQGGKHSFKAKINAFEGEKLHLF